MILLPKAYNKAQIIVVPKETMCVMPKNKEIQTFQTVECVKEETSPSFFTDLVCFANKKVVHSYY